LDGGVLVAEGGSLDLAAGSVLGAGTLSGPGRMTWTGASMQEAVLIIQTQSVLSITGGADKLIAGGRVENYGRVNWSAGRLLGTSGAVVTNHAGGLFDAQADGQLLWGGSGAGPTLHNMAGGTLLKSGGTNATVFVSFALRNGGRLEVASGALSLNGNHALLDGSVIAGGGLVRVDGGTLVVSGQMTVGPGVEPGRFALAGGSLMGDATWTGNGEFDWGPAGLVNSGGAGETMRIAPGFRMNVVGTGDHLQAGGHVLVNQGTIRWIGNSRLVAVGGSVLRNEGLFDGQGDGSLVWGGSGAAGTFVNTGVLRKSAGEGAMTFANTVLLNSGEIQVQSGTVDWNGTHTLSSGTVLSGAGAGRLVGGTLRLDGGVLVAEGGSLDLAAGSVLGAGTLAGDGRATWIGGTLQGVLRIEAGCTLRVVGGADKNLDGAILENVGRIQWSEGRIVGAAGAQIRNLLGGVLELEGDKSFVWGGSGAVPTLRNSGALSLGMSPAVFSLVGAFEQSESGILTVGIGGPTPGPQSYQLRISGTGSLGGVLSVRPFAAFVPTDGQRFSIATFGSRNGTFASLIGEGIDVVAEYRPNELVLVAGSGVTAGQPPRITTQPRGQTVALGAGFTLGVTVTGDPPLRYQWRLNGVNLPGATGATLVVANAQVIHAGNYTVAVENAFGATESEPARIALELPALPMTNQFNARVVVREPARTGQSSNVGATREPGEPNHARKPGAKSVWIAWSPPADGIATVSTAGSAFDTLLAVYTGDSVAALTEVAGDDDSGGFFTSRVGFNATAGTVYNVAVDGLAGAEGSLVLSWSLEVTTDSIPRIVAQPQDQAVGLGGTAVFTVAAQGLDLAYQWFFNGSAIPGATSSSLTRPNVQPADLGAYVVRLSTPGRTIDSLPVRLELTTEPAGAGGPTSSDDKFADVFSGGSPPLGLQQESGDRAIRRPGASVARGFTGTQIFSTTGSTKELGEPNHCGVSGGVSRWFSYEALADGTLSVATDGSDFDTVLAIYSAPRAQLANLELVACDRDSGLDGRDSRVSFLAAAGTVYYVAVDGVNGASGTVQLAYRLETALQLTHPAWTGSAFAFRLVAAPGRLYTIQTSSNALDWTSMLSTNPVAGVTEIVDTNLAFDDLRFYRARLGP
jgi:hypothetical protein